MSIENLVQPWLTQWGVEDAGVLREWIAGMQAMELDGDEVLVAAGQSSRAIYLIHSGLLRLFYTDAEGRERNKAFYGAGDVTGPVSAIMTGRPANFSIQALEPSRLVAADLQSLLQLAPSHAEVSGLVISLLSAAFMRNEEREALLLTCNTEQRYQWLLENQGDLLERIPQYHIAAYLGVDAVSLSRIKRKLREESGSNGAPAP